MRPRTIPPPRTATDETTADDTAAAETATDDTTTDEAAADETTADAETAEEETEAALERYDCQQAFSAYVTSKLTKDYCVTIHIYVNGTTETPVDAEGLATYTEGLYLTEDRAAQLPRRGHAGHRPRCGSGISLQKHSAPFPLRGMGLSAYKSPSVCESAYACASLSRCANSSMRPRSHRSELHRYLSRISREPTKASATSCAEMPMSAGVSGHAGRLKPRRAVRPARASPRRWRA